MRYGDGFWVVRDGRRLPRRSAPFCYPSTRGFEYDDGTGDRGDYLLEPFTVDYVPPSQANGTAYRMTVAGNPNPVLHDNSFDFDFASIPRVLRWAACDKADYRIRVGSLFHDILFCAHHPLFPLDETNLLLREIMEAYSDEKFDDWQLRQKVYSAVRAGGPFVWKKTENELATYRRLFTLDVVPL